MISDFYKEHLHNLLDAYGTQIDSVNAAHAAEILKFKTDIRAQINELIIEIDSRAALEAKWNMLDAKQKMLEEKRSFLVKLLSLKGD